MFTHQLPPKLLRTLAATASLAVSAFAGTLVAADPLPPAAPVATPVAVSDVTLARTILTAFDADPVLKDVNLIVSVVDRVVVIGGPVTSEATKKRAETIVRAVPGIASVRNLCFVEAEPDPLLRAVADRMKPGAKPTGSIPLPGIAIPPDAKDTFLPPVPPQAPSDLLTRDSVPNPVVGQQPNLLGGPVAGAFPTPVLPATPKTITTAPPAAPTSPGALTGTTSVARPADVISAITAIRSTDTRFARLTFSQKPDGGIFVTGFVAKPADAWDFVGEVRKVPGVVRVAVDPQTVK